MAPPLQRRHDEPDHAPLAAAADDGVLPTDVLREVLLRLPAKALCRLRLVCRSWRSLTSDPLFAAAHYVRLSTQPDLACVSVTMGRACVLDRRGRRHGHHHHRQSDPTYKVLRRIALCLDFTGRFPSLRQKCEVTTIGGGAGGWRARPRPPVTVADGPWQMAIVGGVAYFLVNEESFADTEPGCVALFELATEEWRPTLFRGPMSSLRNRSGENFMYHLHKEYFRLVKLNGCLVTIYYNQHDCSADLWFLDMEREKPLWTKRYTIPRKSPWDSHRDYIYPLVVLDDRQIVIWEERAQLLMSYEPRTSRSANLASVKDYLVVQMHHGSLLCSGL
ncbi:hypothetical protein ACP70R_018725 [Stipagrostis hirtigluma subsp. patula]